MAAAPDPPHEGETLSERLAQEMARRWQSGDRQLAEDFLARHPELLRQPEAAIDLIYEELCLRQQHGPPATAGELFRRFPRWRPQLEVLVQFHQFLTDRLTPPPFPGPGESLGEFRLAAELGRGPRSRVFLATQPALAGRPVVLKVVPRDGREHLSLARLQHSHIMPLYAVQDDPERNLRLLCLPYLGGTTLDRLLEGFAGRPPARRSGRDVLEAIDRARPAGAGDPPARGAARDFLARASYARAVCWLGACLADALQYAHERGLVHLDVKPSNVLLAADAQPLLLDFHLARPPLSPGGPPPESLGGTPAFASPEQGRAMEAVRAGQRISGAVDGRSDVYSLGLLLYQALGGPVPRPPGAPPRLERCNDRVSVGLADVIHKALRDRPADRYGDAAALAADLRRHLADLPLRGVPNCSPVERWRKWRRRRPHALRLLAMLGAVLLAAAVVLTQMALSVERRRDEARAHLEQGRRLMRGGQYGVAVALLRRGRDAAQAVPFGGGLRRELEAELRQARLQEARSLLERARRQCGDGRPEEAVPTLRRGLDRLQGLHAPDDLADMFRRQLALARQMVAARDLHLLVNRLRFRYADASPAARYAWQGEEARCLAAWGQRALLVAPPGPDIPPALCQQIREDLLDLAILVSHFRTRWSADRAAARAALRLLAEAERQFGASPVLCRQRQRHAERLGLTAEAREAARRGEELVPRTAWEHYALGRSLLHEGRLAEAAGALRRAVRLQPHGLWPNYYQGVCAHRRGRYEEAVAAFTACVALAPASAPCYANRGLAHAALGRADRALEDYNEALRLEPGLAAAALNRALLLLEAKRYAEASADFRLALGRGADPAAAHYGLALVHRARGDRAAARASLRLALEHDPGHEGARQLARVLDGRP
jgi:serine/threonine protein kinase/Flp pilus assembly protein TadD